MTETICCSGCWRQPYSIDWQLLSSINTIIRYPRQQPRISRSTCGAYWNPKIGTKLVETENVNYLSYSSCLIDSLLADTALKVWSSSVCSTAAGFTSVLLSRCQRERERERVGDALQTLKLREFPCRHSPEPSSLSQVPRPSSELVLHMFSPAQPVAPQFTEAS